jgi:hypothetical protein
VSGEPDGGSPIQPGTTKRKEPRWVIAFLRALERTGDARASAADAGIDYTTAYARRRAHADFAAAWAEALAAHKRGVREAEVEELEGFENALRAAPSTIGSSADGPPPRSGEELVVSGGRVKRAGRDRWGPRKEKIFFDELAATNNIKRSAAAAGVSYNAVHARRLRHPAFRSKWDAVVQCAKAGIGMYVLEAGKKTFDPDELDLSGEMPKMTIAEAIRISESGAGKGSARGQAQEPDPFAEEGPTYEEEMADIREQLVRKLQRLRRRDRPDKIAAGWSYDESWDVDIPPGWAKTADWRPMTPDDIV